MRKCVAALVFSSLLWILSFELTSRMSSNKCDGTGIDPVLQWFRDRVVTGKALLLSAKQKPKSCM